MYNYFIIGFMLSGKTTIGKILSNKIKKKFIDLDKKIEFKINKSILYYFKYNGEKNYRKIESFILKKNSLKKNIILSTGGGIINYYKNRIILKNKGIIFFLNNKLNNLLSRINLKKINKRPLLYNKKINILFKKRYIYYKNISDFTINTLKKDIFKTIKIILNIIKLTN